MYNVHLLYLLLKSEKARTKNVLRGSKLTSDKENWLLKL